MRSKRRIEIKLDEHIWFYVQQKIPQGERSRIIQSFLKAYLSIKKTENNENQIVKKLKEKEEQVVKLNQEITLLYGELNSLRSENQKRKQEKLKESTKVIQSIKASGILEEVFE